MFKLFYSGFYKILYFKLHEFCRIEIDVLQCCLYLYDFLWDTYNLALDSLHKGKKIGPEVLQIK